ncbi:hypothetical protein M0657_007522 [Pyricularia oryzae]|nr:hypothetical protein M9X92_007340 [Pyricularia oryzae]KAI7918578.1 hypothetical protein M0657_007522 [Pyricularia oryzae]
MDEALGLGLPLARNSKSHELEGCMAKHLQSLQIDAKQAGCWRNSSAIIAEGRRSADRRSIITTYTLTLE